MTTLYDLSAQYISALNFLTDPENDIDRSSMEGAGFPKVTSFDVSVSLAKLPPAVVVVEEAIVPDQFWREKIVREIDKAAIKQAGGCEGAMIMMNGFRVSIK